MLRTHGRRGGLLGVVLLAGLVTAPAAPAQNCDSGCKEPCPPWIKYHFEGPPRIKYKHGCPKPICDWCNLPHYGYYQTCWRPWAFPPDWSHCPVPPPGALVPLIPPPRGATFQEPPHSAPPPRPDDRKDPNVKPPIDPTSGSQPAWLPPLAHDKTDKLPPSPEPPVTPTRGSETRMDSPRGETPPLDPVKNNDPPLAPAPKSNLYTPLEKTPPGPVVAPPLPEPPVKEPEVQLPAPLSKKETPEVPVPPALSKKESTEPKPLVEVPTPPMPTSGVQQTGALVSRDDPQKPKSVNPANPNMRMVNSRRITLDYETDAASKDALLELWYTQDGRKWHRDPTSVQAGAPHMIEVNKEGTYGFTLVARHPGEKSEEPAADEAPQVWVEVDWSKPTVQLVSVQPSAGTPDRQLSIVWLATDKSLARQPITLSWSETLDGPWKSFATNVENTGRYTWQVPNNVPNRFYVRVEAFDLVGNVGVVTTPSPVVMSSR